MKHYDLKKLFPVAAPRDEVGVCPRLIVLHSLFKGEIGVYRLPGPEGVAAVYSPGGSFPKLTGAEIDALSPDAVDAAIREAIARGNVWPVPESEA